MTQSTLTAVLSYAVIRHPLGLRHSAALRRHFYNFGGRYSVISFTEFLTGNLDALIIGKMLGAAPAGYYNRAILLANLPVQQPANILTKALFPIMSSVGNQHDKQIISLQLSTLLVGSYAFAVGAGIFVAASDIVTVLLGNQWLDTIPILQMLSWSVGPIYTSHVAGVTLDSMNKLKIKLRIQITILILLIVLLLLVAPRGSALDIAAVVVATEWIRVFLMEVTLVRLLRISVRELGLITLCIAIITVSTSVPIWSISELMSPNVISIIRLSAEIVVGAIGLLLGILITRYIAVRLPAIRFLAQRASIVAKLLPKFA